MILKPGTDLVSVLCVTSKEEVFLCANSYNYWLFKEIIFSGSCKFANFSNKQEMCHLSGQGQQVLSLRP